MIKNWLISCVLCLLLLGCGGIKQQLLVEKTNNRINTLASNPEKLYSDRISGAMQMDLYLGLLKGKKVGVIGNQTSVLADGKHLVDFLIEKNINVCRIFSPEHGFRGKEDAGEKIEDGKDKKTGISIISLYGNNKKPSQEQLKDLEVLVFDIQDVGVRFYTYISTLHYVMEACSEVNLPLILLDRANPNMNVVDGPILKKKYKSFVGMHPVPIIYGMTIGEYGLMINGEGWLKDHKKCNLTVIPCEKITRNDKISITTKPSPNLPNDQSIALYASLCLFEGTNVSVGRGTEKPFQIYGSPWLKEMPFQFVPKPTEGAKKPMHQDLTCFGEDLSSIVTDGKISLKWLQNAYQKTSNKELFFNPFFTKLAGTTKLEKQIKRFYTEDEIKESWKSDLEEFEQIRQKYLLYKN